mgnify:CR=1 FL=1
MSYNQTYSEIKQILKDSKRISKVTMLKVAKLAIIETMGETRTLDVEVTWDSKLGDDLELDSLDMVELVMFLDCLLYTSPSPRDRTRSRMPSSA